MAGPKQNVDMPRVLGQQAAALQRALVELYDFVVAELDPDPLSLLSYLPTEEGDAGYVELLKKSLPGRVLLDPSGDAE